MEPNRLYNNEKETTQEKSEINSNTKIDESWTEEDTVRLLFIVNNLGRKWKMIAENYKSQLKNMNEQFLNKKYWKLKRNKIKFQY